MSCGSAVSCVLPHNHSFKKYHSFQSLCSDRTTLHYLCDQKYTICAIRNTLFVPSFAFCPGFSPASQCGALEEDNTLRSYCTQLRSIRREGDYRSFRTTLTLSVSPGCCWMVWILKSILDTPPKAPAGSRMKRTLIAHGSNQCTFVLPLSSFLSHIPPILPPALRLPPHETTCTHIFISHLAFERNSAHRPDSKV